jgi:hypothetical protein
MNYGNNFMNDFFKRTLHNLKVYQAQFELENCDFKYEITQLINSLLGLVIFLKESQIHFENNDESLKLFMRKNDPEIWSYSEEHCFKNYFRHLRNSIAHKRIEIIPNEKNEIYELVFNDKNGKNGEFKLKLSINSIRELIDLMQEKLVK